MGDARLRELERRWTETQAPADEAAYLRARLHAGTLTRSQVELWAYCERPAALLALPDPGPAPPAQLMRWVEGLERFGRRPCAAAAVAALAFVWPALEALPPHILEPLARARALAEEWVRSPSFAVRSRVDEAAQAVRFELHDLRSPPDRRRMNAHHALKAASSRFGEVRLLGVRRCEPCVYLAKLLGDPRLLKALVGRGGLRCDVVVAGTITRGDAVVPA